MPTIRIELMTSSCLGFQVISNSLAVCKYGLVLVMRSTPEPCGLLLSWLLLSWLLLSWLLLSWLLFSFVCFVLYLQFESNLGWLHYLSSICGYYVCSFRL
ncbi:hypothetical protein V8F06_007469 [Rhypophila decipiens]